MKYIIVGAIIFALMFLDIIIISVLNTIDRHRSREDRQRLREANWRAGDRRR